MYYGQQNTYYPFGGGYIPQQNRLNQLEQQMMQTPSSYGTGQFQTPTQNILKGRPVVSIEEARASQIDLDGSLFIFTDIGNKKIYTKQINLDGTASLNTYSLVEDNNSASPKEERYVSQDEFTQTISMLKAELEKLKGEGIKNESSTVTNGTVSAKPSF